MKLGQIGTGITLASLAAGSTIIGMGLHSVYKNNRDAKYQEAESKLSEQVCKKDCEFWYKTFKSDEFKNLDMQEKCIFWQNALDSIKLARSPKSIKKVASDNAVSIYNNIGAQLPKSSKVLNIMK